MSMDACLIAMHTETYDILLAPLATSESVGVLCPFIDSIHQLDVPMVGIRIGSVRTLHRFLVD